MIEISRDVLFQIFTDYIQHHTYFKLKQISKIIAKTILKIDSKNYKYDKIIRSITTQLYNKFIKNNSNESIIPYNYTTYKIIRK